MKIPSSLEGHVNPTAAHVGAEEVTFVPVCQSLVRVVVPAALRDA